MSRLTTWVGLILFFLIVVFPAEHMILKLPFVIFITITCIVDILIKKKIVIYKPIFALVLLITTKGIIWTIIGFLNGNAGALTVVYVNVVWYLLFGLFISEIKTLDVFFKVLTILLASGAAFVLFDLAFVLMSFGVLPHFEVSSLFNIEEFYFSIISDAGFSYLQTNHLNNLVFIYPLTLFLLVSEKKVDTRSFFTSKTFLIIFVILELILMVLSGRRIMILTIFTAPIYIWIFLHFYNKKIRLFINKNLRLYLVIFGVITIMGIEYFLIQQNITIGSLGDRFLAAFDSKQEPVRFTQAQLLFKGFMDSPIIGNGAAAEILGFKRSSAVPWAFEQSYIDDLFKTGILGASMFWIFIGGIIYYGIKLIKRTNDELITGLLIGLISFLVANGTNPFLSSFDYFWPIFLPMAYINAYWQEKNNSRFSQIL